MFTGMQTTSDNIAIIVLAAGASSRMSRPKQLLKIGGETLIEKMTNAALSAAGGQVIVVLGAFYEEIAETLKHFPVTLLKNDYWRDGMSSSVTCAMEYIHNSSPDTEAVILMVGDQPYLTPATLKRLVSKWKSSGKAIIASSYADTYGVPVLFSRNLFSELAALKGSNGAKSILAKHREAVELVAFPGGATDLDTPDDWAKFKG